MNAFINGFGRFATYAVPATAVLLAGCGGPARYQVKTPFIDVDIDDHYIPTGPLTVLPGDYRPDGKDDLIITINGHNYPIRVCVAVNRDPNLTNCIYYNIGGCDQTSGWKMACRSVAHPDGGPGNHDTGGWGSGQSTGKANAIGVSQTPACPDEWGMTSYEPTTGVVTMSFSTGCGDQHIPDGLVDVTITSPDGVSLPADEFAIEYNGVMPAGSLVSIEAPYDVAVWDCYRLHRTSLSFTSEDGDLIEAGIGIVRSGLPVAILAVNGEIRHTMIVAPPAK